MKMDWFIYAIIALICFSVLFLLIKYALNLGVSSEVGVFYQMAITAIILAVFFVATKTSFKVGKSALIVLVLMGIVSVLANVFLFKAIGAASNAGYALAITNLNALLVLIASIFIFKADFDLLKVLGAILAVVGVILLGLK